ncbi:MAG TPA: response regulator [Thermoanaerobaculia bacterium]|nr:response regulator [Thermoanaerobaculia bacterium]
MRVLIAEDEKKTRAMLVEMLQSLGCETVEAASGYETVKLVQEHRPEVLLLDGLLPEMHGFEIARFVRSMAPEYRPRIVIITAVYKSQRYQNEAKLQFGVDHYLLKPVTKEAVANAVFGPDSKE